MPTRTSTSSRDLGRLCSGKTDARGLLQCEAELQRHRRSRADRVRHRRRRPPGAARRARSGSAARTTTGSAPATRTASTCCRRRSSTSRARPRVFQVRMPFREATALVAVEREGVIETSVVTLTGSSPVIRVPVTAAHAPNVYVSVLAVRAAPARGALVFASSAGAGASRATGWPTSAPGRRPARWWTWRGRHSASASPRSRVGAASHQLAVKVSTPQASYPVRGRARGDGAGQSARRQAGGRRRSRAGGGR